MLDEQMNGCNIRAGRRWKHLLGETTVNTLEVQHGS